MQNAEGEWIWNPSKGYNAWVDTLPEEECVWLTILDADQQLNISRRPDSFGQFPWNVDDWDEVEQWVRQPQVQEAVENFQDSAGRPHMGYALQTDIGPEVHEAYKRHNPTGMWEWEPRSNLPENPPEGDLIYHYVSASSVVVNAQVASVLVGAMNEETDAVVSGVTSVISFRALMDDQSAMAQLMYCSNVKKASLALLSVLEETPEFLSDAQLQELDDLYASLMDSGVLLFEVDAERLKFADTVRRCLNRRGKFDAKRAVKFLDAAANHGSFDVKDPSPVSLEFSKLAPGVQSTLQLSTDVLRIMHEESKIPWAGNNELESIISTGDTLVSGILESNFIEFMIPGYQRVASVSRETQQRVMATRLVIAIHRHQLRHDVFPESIEKIDADLLGFDPIDAFTGELLGFYLMEDTPIVYSVGSDLDDDDGAYLWAFGDAPQWVIPEEVGQRKADGSWDLDGDWLLFPVIGH
ncbi:MAG: hypothetical protein JKY96_08715 [Phycisphaerales bacterium]|nr:hypothetical protein [Phycisphaerales bacterium]